jgi:hypothetical protein
MYSRRKLLQLLSIGAVYPLLGDWDHETPIVTTIREYLESVIGSLSMALDFRAINHQQDEEFRIQINAFGLMPVASCFKAFLVLYYFLNTPQEAWEAGENTTVYSTAVYSNNVQTGVLLDEVGQRVPGRQNAIEKFNDFLHTSIGLTSGLHTWDWPENPLVGVSDPRFVASNTHAVIVDGQLYQVDNAFTAADLARGYDFLTRGEYFTHITELRDAIQATRTLLSISAADYQSPIERVYPSGYMGKDGILPGRDIAVGRVVNDAGVISIEDRSYILAFMSAGESESTVIDILREVVNQISVYEENAP